MGVPNRFFGTPVFRYLKLGIRDWKAKSGRVSVLKVCVQGGIAQILGRDCGIEEPYWGPSDLSSFLTSQGGLILRLYTHDLLIIFPLGKTFLRVIRNKRKTYRNFPVIASNL